MWNMYTTQSPRLVYNCMHASIYSFMLFFAIPSSATNLRSLEDIKVKAPALARVQSTLGFVRCSCLLQLVKELFRESGDFRINVSQLLKVH